MTLPSGNMHIGDLYEMPNFSPKTTGLSPGIAVWCRTDLTDHGHNRYMVKIRKNGEWAGIYTVGSSPSMAKNINGSISGQENTAILRWVSEYASLIIGLIDGKLDSSEFGIGIQKLRGS